MTLTPEQIKQIRTQAGVSPILPSQTATTSLADRLGLKPPAQEEQVKSPTIVDRVKSKLQEATGNMTKNIQESADLYKTGQQGLGTTIAQTVGNSIKGAGSSFAAVPGAIVEEGIEQISPYVPQSVKDTGKAIVDKVVEIAQPTVEEYNKLTPSQKASVKATGGAISGITDLATGVVGAKTGATALMKGTDILEKAGDTAYDAGKVISKARADRAIKSRTNELAKVVQNNASLRKVINNSNAKGLDTISDLSKTDLLNDAIDNTGTIKTQSAIEKLNEFIRPQEDVISSSLLKEGKLLEPKYIQEELTKAINDSGVKGAAKIRALKGVQDDIEGYLLDATPEGKIPVSVIHDAKVDKYANINYLNPESARVDKIVAKRLKELVENNTDSVDVKSLNTELSKYYSMQKLLETLDGKKVEGGRLGKLFAQSVGAVVGNSIGGPLGALAGAELGGFAKGLKMSRKFGKGGGELQMSKQMENALQSSKNDGNLNINQSTNIAPTKNVISEIIPQSTEKTSGKVIPKELQPLAEEANKYKSEEDFISKYGKSTKNKAILTKLDKLSESEGQKVVIADVDKLLASKWYGNKPGESGITRLPAENNMKYLDKLSRAQDFIKDSKGTDIEMPSMTFMKDGTIMNIEGKHRFLAFKKAGAKDIAISVPKNTDVSKLGWVKYERPTNIQDFYNQLLTQ